MNDTSGNGGSDSQPSLHQSLRCQDCNRHWWDQKLPLPWFPSPSPEHGIEGNRSSLSTVSLTLSMSDRSEGSWHSQWGWQHWEDGAHMKINLPVFKDEDAKDAVTYQSWRWDLTVYQHVGCRDCTLLPYAIWSLQGYPSKLVWSSGMDITLGDVLTILDEHYNTVKALDVLNQATDNPPKPRATSFFPQGNSRAASPPQRHQLCIWHIWRKRKPVAVKMERAVTTVESKQLPKSLFCAW